MAGETTEDEEEGAGADDARDDADLRAGALESRALLDVELEVSGERRRVAARRSELFLLQSGTRNLGQQSFTAAARGTQRL